jgi:hypothetical protein
MIKTLSQIVASFLALVIGFIVAYLIYLNSVQANIDEELQVKGSEIVSILKTAPIYKYEPYLYVSDFNLLMQYQDKYPDKSPVDIHEQIAQDLFNAIPFEQKDAIDRLAEFKEHNAKGPILGRIWINLIKNSVDNLAPGEVWWPGRGHVLASSGYPRSTEQTELFPFGPLGVEQWSNDFQAVKNNVDFLIYKKEYFLEDLQEFFKQSDEEWIKKRGRIFDFKGWIKEIEDVLLKIEKENNHIQSLLRLKKSYSLTNRLPNIRLIGLLNFLAFISGVVVPILFLCFKKDENELSPSINLFIAGTTFIFLIGGTAFLIKDVAFPHKNEYVETKYLFTLRKQLIDDKNSHEQRVSFDYRILSHLLSDKSTIDLPKELISLLEQYRKAVIDSNSCSEKMSRALSDDLSQSNILKAYKVKADGHTERIMDLMSLEKRRLFFEKTFNPFNIIPFEAEYGGFTRIVLTIRLPESVEQINQIKTEIDRVYNKHLESENGKDCISMRNSLKNTREKLMIHLSKLTESVNKQ